MILENKKLNNKYFVLFILALLITTFLRPLLIFIYPFFLYFFMKIFKLKAPKYFELVIATIIISTLISSIYIEEFFLINHIVSILLILPFFLFLLSEVNENRINILNQIKDKFIYYMTTIMSINIIVGTLQFITNSNDDAFIGLYGRHGLGNHGLSVISLLLSAYYLNEFSNNKNKRTLLFALFFLYGFIMGFYGAAFVGLIVCIIIINYKKLLNLKLLFIIFSIIGAIYYLNEKVFIYNIHMINMFFQPIRYLDLSIAPRKLILFYNYIKIFFNDIYLLLFGTGPGTFNSRISFMFNGDFANSFSVLFKSFGSNAPAYANEYVYPLWNSAIASIRYMDGTINQPFSTCISLLSEYGIFFVCVVIILLIKKIKYISSITKKHLFHKKYIFFLLLFLLWLFFIDNYIEYPDIMILFLLLIKFSEIHLYSLKLERGQSNEI
jgi:hypothetical protein